MTLETATPAELETLLCDCGCALVVIGWPDAGEPLAEVVLLRAASPGALSDAA